MPSDTAACNAQRVTELEFEERLVQKGACTSTLPSAQHLPEGPRFTPIVVAESLSKRFGTVVAVDSLSFALQPGTITGFLGPNGAGKTTTLRMLLGLAEPRTRDIREARIEGQNVELGSW
jgi:ABC-type glutathione transport system ATPase component